MSVESARAALINLASDWRKRCGDHYSPGAGVMLGCARELDELAITHLSAESLPGIGRLRRATGAFDKAMQAELIPAHVRRRVINLVLYGHPDGQDAIVRPSDVDARLEIRTSDRNGPA